jgi:hypothetical protein
MSEENQDDKYEDLLSHQNDKIDYLESKINKQQNTLTTFKIIIAIAGLFLGLYLLTKYEFLLELSKNLFFIIFSIAYFIGGAIFCYTSAKKHYAEKRYADVVAMFFIWFFFGGGIIIGLGIWDYLFW